MQAAHSQTSYRKIRNYARGLPLLYFFYSLEQYSDMSRMALRNLRTLLLVASRATETLSQAVFTAFKSILLKLVFAAWKGLTGLTGY